MLWILEQCNLWGDYGDVLISGYARREAAGGPLLLERTGPFLPPISFPWSLDIGHAIVVSHDFKLALEDRLFPGVQFAPARKERIVRLNWHEWDRAADKPEKYPREGEPENYIFGKKLNPKTAGQMPEAWELKLPIWPLHLERIENPDRWYDYRYRAKLTRQGFPPMFTDQEQCGKHLVDDAARIWLTDQVGEWVSFRLVEVDHDTK
jgi:hypothetical protein